MELHKHLKIGWMVMSAVLFAACLFPPFTAKAASTHTITYKSLDGSVISTADIADGSSLGALPAQTDLVAWIYDDCRMADSSTVPTADMTITAYHESDCSAFGTLDSGYVTWFIYDKKLYITGDGTLSISPKVATGVTKKYAASLDAVPVNEPAVRYSWMDERQVGDTAYGAYETPSAAVSILDLGTRQTAFTGDRRQWVSDDIGSFVPWESRIGNVTDIYVADDVTLAGNFSFFFNLNSDYADYGKIKASKFKNLQNVYLFADTSGVTSFSGTFGAIPTLENVFVREGKDLDLSACQDTSGMFYGDASLKTSAGTSAINHLDNFGSVVNARYMFFGCRNIEKPMLSTLDTSALVDATFMFAGCAQAGLVCDNSTEKSNLAAWDMSNVVSTAGMFSGIDIDPDVDDPMNQYMSNGGMAFLEDTGAHVVGDTFDLSKWDLSKLVISYYMFSQNAGLKNAVMTGNYPELTDTSCMYALCTGLERADLSGADLGALKYADIMFYGSGASGSTASFRGAELGALEDASYMFYASKLKTIDFDDTNPYRLVMASGMFDECAYMTSLGDDALSGWDLSKVVDAGFMFNRCRALPKVNCSGFSMDALQNAAYMFSECEAMEALPISSWNTSNLIMMDCFAYQCKNVTSIQIENWDTDNLTSAFFAFAFMDALQTANLNNWNTPVLVVASGMFANDPLLTTMKGAAWSAPCLNDASGFFYQDGALITASIGKLINGGAEDLAFFFSGCEALQTVDLSNWDTAGVKYMQGFCEDNTSLQSILIGTNFNTASVLDMGTFFKGDEALTDASLNAFLENASFTSCQRAVEMCKNTKKLTAVDLSGTTFHSLSNMSAMFYGDNDLLVITLPQSFMKAVTNQATNAEHVFYCSINTPTLLTIKNSSIPTYLASYDWAGDNRTFLLHGDQTVNGKKASTATITSTDSAVLGMDVTPTLYLNDKEAALTYAWKKGTSAISGSNASTYTVSGSKTGTYTGTATITGLTHGDSVSDTFTVNYQKGISSMLADYDGEDIIVSKKYDKDDVTVTVTFDDGTKKILKSNEFSVDSEKVKKKGTNKFYAYYTYGSTTYTAPFSVTGYRAVGKVEASYNGPDVEVGKQFNSSYVTMTAYYEDDDDKEDGFTVTPSSFSTRYVNAKGNNTIVAYYKDSKSGETLHDDFSVPGFVAGEETTETTPTIKGVSKIEAYYLGPDIPVGGKYNKSDVAVAVYYRDGSPYTNTTDFQVNGMDVKTVGANTFKARVLDENGNAYTAEFTVNGYEPQSGTSSAAAPTAKTRGNVQTSDESKVGWLIFFIAGCSVLLVILFVIRKHLNLRERK